MKKATQALRRYGKIYGVFFRNSVMSQMAYRANFIMGCLVQLAFMLVKATYAIVVQSVGVPVMGVTPDEMLLFIGTYSALSGVYMSFFYFNFVGISEKVKRGDLDMLLTKPVSTQFLVSLEHVNIGYALVSVPVGGAMVVMGWVRAGVPVDAKHILGYLALTAAGLAMAYALFLIPNLLAFWFVANQGMGMLVDMLWDFNNLPMVIYNRVVQFVGLFLVPIFVITNMGSLAALNRLPPPLGLWAFLSPVIVFFFQRLLWKKALRKYSSASS